MRNHFTSFSERKGWDSTGQNPLAKTPTTTAIWKPTLFRGTYNLIDTRQRGSWVVCAKGVQSILSEDAVEDARGAAYAVGWFVWNGCDGRVVWCVMEFRRIDIGYV